MFGDTEKVDFDLQQLKNRQSAAQAGVQLTQEQARQMTPEQRKVYDAVVRQWGRISNFSQVLAHQPAALAGWLLPNESIRLDNVKCDPGYVQIQQIVIARNMVRDATR